MAKVELRVCCAAAVCAGFQGLSHPRLFPSSAECNMANVELQLVCASGAGSTITASKYDTIKDLLPQILRSCGFEPDNDNSILLCGVKQVSESETAGELEGKVLTLLRLPWCACKCFRRDSGDRVSFGFESHTRQSQLRIDPDGTFKYADEVSRFVDRSTYTEVIRKRAKGTWELEHGDAQVVLSGEMIVTKLEGSIFGRTINISAGQFQERFRKEELRAWTRYPYTHVQIQQYQDPNR
mmetsp:Transcript_76191/g.132190  ORF Transcript_76191/g.132190 Transcript_76191/m.132190 type:complete len:239 (-) Transcript_76191:122-838(-)